MKKRTFIKTTAIIGAGALVAPLVSCKENTTTEVAAAETVSEFTLPALPYALGALEPYIDTQTMTIHHGKHHAGYVRKLNNALKDNTGFAGKSLENILSGVSEADGDTAVRNNGGGHYNHSLFWNIMAPSAGSSPTGKLSDAINASFDSFDGFKTIFSKAGATQFGSGWAWLAVDAAGKLFISSTPNQDNPMMSKIVDQSGTPILGIDVWEHAYYLKYQNKRKEYISNFFSLINWDQVAKNYAAVG